MSLQLDPNKIALVLIDLQHGIVSRPLQPYSSSQVVQNSSHLAAAFRNTKATVVYVHVDLANRLPLIVDTPMGDPKAPPPPPIASELVPEAGFQAGDLLITKRHWGAFGLTELEATLRSRGVETIVLAGIATNYGVESTARQAASLGFNVILCEDACSTMDAAAHQFAVEKIFPLIGRVRKTQEILDALA